MTNVTYIFHYNFQLYNFILLFIKDEFVMNLVIFLDMNILIYFIF